MVNHVINFRAFLFGLNGFVFLLLILGEINGKISTRLKKPNINILSLRLFLLLSYELQKKKKI